MWSRRSRGRRERARAVPDEGGGERPSGGVDGVGEGWGFGFDPGGALEGGGVVAGGGFGGGYPGMGLGATDPDGPL